MNQLWVLMTFSLFLTGIYRSMYAQVPNNILRQQKISIAFLILTLVLGGFLGLRQSYNDTYTYKTVYESMETFPEFWESFNPSLSADPGFNLCNAFMKTKGVSTQNWLMIYALVTIGMYLHFIRKNANDMLLNIFLFFCVGSYTFAGAAIKQSIATAICLVALSFALERKWIRYFLFVFIAMTFHVYSAVYLLVPLLMFKPWTKNTAIMLGMTIVIAFSLQYLFGTINEITSSIGETYSSTEFSGDGVNVFRVLVCNMPLFLALVYHRELFTECTQQEALMFNLSMINGCIMFIGLFGTANYFARLANYFVATQVITLPWICAKIPERDRKIIKICMIVGYLIYFYYSTNVVYGKFTNGFRRITVAEYLKQWF